MTERKFYKTIFKVEVLSEEPLSPDMSLDDLNYTITEGDCSGKFIALESQVLNGRQAAEELQKQGSDPGFFNLDEKGNELGDELNDFEETEGQDRENYTDIQDRENYNS